MNYSDEELQDMIENKKAVADSIDAKAYQTVFDALDKETYRLPISFADNVVARLESHKTGYSRDYLWMAVGLIIFITATAVTIVATGFSTDFGVFRFISGYPGLFVFGLAFVLIIQYLDKRLVIGRWNV